MTFSCIWSKYWKMDTCSIGKNNIVVIVWYFVLVVLIQYYRENRHKQIWKYSNKLNISKTSDQSYMILTRVPKTGGEMLRNILYELSLQKNYSYYNGERMADARRGQLKHFEDRKYYIDLWKGESLSQTHTGMRKRNFSPST